MLCKMLTGGIVKTFRVIDCKISYWLHLKTSHHFSTIPRPLACVVSPTLSRVVKNWGLVQDQTNHFCKVEFSLVICCTFVFEDKAILKYILIHVYIYGLN